MPKEQEQQRGNEIASIAEVREVAEELTAEQQEWFRLAGFTRTEWRRLLFARWLYRQGQLTDYSPRES